MRVLSRGGCWWVLVGAGGCGVASPEEIVARLEAEGSPWAEKTLQTLRRQSPTSVKITCAPAAAACCGWAVLTLSAADAAAAAHVAGISSARVC
eukprot:COSAG01_NODE_3692_length_5789_cov_4.628295_2_plen_94_part_00